MSYRTLAWLPLAIAGAFAALWLVVPHASHDALFTIEVESAKALGLLGAAAAAASFKPGDYLQRAWGLLGASILVLFARDAFALAQEGAGDATGWLVEGGLATAGNALSVAGTWMLARAWRVAGLEDDDAADGGPALLAGAVVVALVATGWPIFAEARALAGGDVRAVVPLASCVADGIVIALLGPLARTTLALEGGLLRWPWALLTVNGALWLVFDLAYGGASLLHASPEATREALGALRALPSLYMLSAGLAQRKVLAA